METVKLFLDVEHRSLKLYDCTRELLFILEIRLGSHSAGLVPADSHARRC